MKSGPTLIPPRRDKGGYKDIHMRDLKKMAQAAKAASRQLSILTTDQKDTALSTIADELESQADTVLAQNALDIADGKAKGLGEALLDRLLLTEQRIAALVADTRHVTELPDPVGSDIESRVLPNGMRLSKRRIPIGCWESFMKPDRM